MTPAAAELLADLEAAEWFRSAGTKTGLSDERALFLANWPDAFEACRAASWEEICRVTGQLLFQRVAEVNPEEAAEWQDAVAEMFPHTADLVPRKAVKILREFTPTPVFVSTLSWTVQHALLEAEFLGRETPGWYGNLAAWIVDGHFPCGWSGAWPRGGRLIVL
ncbi:MAG: hypothetical protein IT452_15925 [Planctomycetia bacterium]|nr:hypothetical protein [Planctomycetia bacterium]